MRPAASIFGGTSLLAVAAAATWVSGLRLGGVEPAAAAEVPMAIAIATSPTSLDTEDGAAGDGLGSPDQKPNSSTKTTESDVELDPLLRGVARALGMPAPPDTHWKLGVGPLLRAVGLPNLFGGTVTARDDANTPGEVGSLSRLWSDVRGSVGSILDGLDFRGMGVRQLAMVPVWTLTFLDGDKPSPAPRGDAAHRHVVVLVHGLDEPGWIWDELAPALHKEGFCPVAFEYPNDGPLRTSADCLGEALARLREDGVECVDLVSHSMGGLIVRDVLTRPAWYDGDASGNALLPMVDRVIQVAPPNHGASIATLQPISELKDHAVRLMRGTAKRHGMSRDGNGEAAGDLQPDSAYLSELNRRTGPRGARFTIVEACLAKPPEAPSADDAGGSAPDNPLTATAAFCREASRTVGSSVSGWLGDGLVTTESARLAGVDDIVVVTGNHHSVLRTWVPGRVAPGVAVVVERLRSR